MSLHRDFCRAGGNFYNFLSLGEPLRCFHPRWKTETVLNRRQLFISFAPLVVRTLQVFLLGPFVNIKHNHISKKTWFCSSNQMFSVGSQNCFVLCNNIGIPLFPAHIYLAGGMWESLRSFLSQFVFRVLKFFFIKGCIDLLNVITSVFL